MALSISDQYMADCVASHGATPRSVSDHTFLSLGSRPSESLRDIIVTESVPIRAGTTIFLEIP